MTIVLPANFWGNDLFSLIIPAVFPNIVEVWKKYLRQYTPSITPITMVSDNRTTIHQANINSQLAYLNPGGGETGTRTHPFSRTHSRTLRHCLTEWLVLPIRTLLCALFISLNIVFLYLVFSFINHYTLLPASSISKSTRRSLNDNKYPLKLTSMVRVAWILPNPWKTNATKADTCECLLYDNRRRNENKIWSF